MRNWFRIAILFLLWGVNLFVGTGLDTVYHVTQYTRWLVILITVVVLLIKVSQGHSLRVDRKRLFIFTGMIVVFFTSAVLHGCGTQVMQYLWVFLLVYLIAQIPFTKQDLFWIGLLYGAAGFVVLVMFKYGRVFSGWNENSIAMIGVFSFLVMLIPLYKEHSNWSKVLIIALTVLFAYYVNPTNSRASILFMSVGVLFALGLLNRDLLTKRGGRLTVILLIPLFIAIITILVSKGRYMASLDTWSYMRFGKPFFNGRDTTWLQGHRLLERNFLIGAGNLMIANWHNSAISVLTAYGVLGYLLWLAAIRDILSRAYPYVSDYIVQGCFVGFIIIYLQQSLELGLVSTNPTLIPYVILGLMLGRIRYLKKELGANDKA